MGIQLTRDLTIHVPTHLHAGLNPEEKNALFSGLRYALGSGQLRTDGTEQVVYCNRGVVAKLRAVSASGSSDEPQRFEVFSVEVKPLSERDPMLQFAGAK